MSYQKEREDFIASITKHGMPLDVARLLLREATGINRRAELACSSEAADRDRVPCPRVKGEKIANRGTVAASVRAFEQYPCLCDMYQGTHQKITRITLQDWYSERRIDRALEKLNASVMAAGGTFDAAALPLWRMITSGDPRGYTLRVVPPAYAEENAGRSEHDPRSIGVPPGPSGLRW